MLANGAKRSNMSIVWSPRLRYKYYLIRSMFIKPTNVYEIKKITSELHSGKSPEYDGFSAKVIKGISANHCLISVK